MLATDIRSVKPRIKIDDILLVDSLSEKCIEMIATSLCVD